MNRQEYDIVKCFTYDQYCEYLKKKYGQCIAKYGSKKNTRPGYFIHHIAEDKIPSLSHPKQKKQYPEYQAPELLIYCDYLEHLLLHIMIGREKDPALHLGLNGPCRFIIPNLINFYEHGVKQKIDDLYYSLIEADKDVFGVLLDEYNELVKDIDLVLEHNVSLYAQIEEALDTKGKAHATLGTGLGKTTLALQYVKTHSCRALVICPNNIVKDSWVGNGSWTIPVTYQTLTNKYDPETDTLNFDLSGYNLVILDEVHHAGYDEESGRGALLWGKAIKKLFDSGIKILGLTATEIRSDGIDVSEQFFEGCNFEGYSFEKAIEEGIVHPISYVTAVYDWSEIDEELESLGVKVNHDPGYQKLRGQLDVARNNTPELATILRNSLRVPQSEMRGIAFIQNEKDEERVLSILRDAYPGVLLLSINSHMDKKDVDKNKKLFADPETKNAILVAINMVTEGAHYKGINTGIMFRTTESWVLYAQMVGRFSVLTTYPNPNGVIIDLVNNLNRIKYNDRVKDTKKKPVSPQLKTIIRKLAEKSDQIIYEDYTQDFVMRMHELKEYCDDSWEDWEIDILQKYYATEGSKGCQQRLDEGWEIRYHGQFNRELKIKPRKSLHAIQSRVHWLRNKGFNIPRSESFWTDEAAAILKEDYPKYGGNSQRLLDIGYTNAQIYQKARREGIKFNDAPKRMPWTEEDIIKLQQCVTLEDAMNLFPLKTRGSILAAAKRHKISLGTYKNPIWTQQQLDILKSCCNLKEAISKLPFGRNNILSKIKELNFVFKKKAIIPKDAKLVKCIETGEIHYASHFIKSGTIPKATLYAALKSNKEAYGYHWEYVD